MANLKLSRLANNVPIVDEKGHPTPLFQRLIQQLLEEKQLIEEQAELTAGIDIIAGTGLSGGGPLDGSGDVTVDLDAVLSDLTDVDTSGAAGGDVLTYDSGTWVPAASGGGISTGAAVVRNSRITSSSAASYVLTWPVGTVADDLVIIFGGHGFSINIPAGWELIDQKSGTNWNGAVFAKRMTAADITAGSVTVTTTGAFNGVFALVSLINADVNQVVGFATERSGSGASPAAISREQTSSTNLFLCFGSNRAASNNTITTTGVTALQTVNAASASGVLGSASPLGGTIAVGFSVTFSTVGTGYYVAMVIVSN